jgi:hypothetical protein
MLRELLEENNPKWVLYPWRSAAYATIKGMRSFKSHNRKYIHAMKYFSYKNTDEFLIF